jgi:formamidopyrimidine-DNA glycosylase
MPELAEVEFFRRRWWEAGSRRMVCAAVAEPRSRVYRYLPKEFPGGAAGLAKILPGSRLTDSGTDGKQMWFVFALKPPRHGARSRLWLGVHLGMTGEMRVESVDYLARKHDALILRLTGCSLVFHDPRQFGRVRAWQGTPGARPPWRENLPPEILSSAFTIDRVRGALARHGRAPVKAVLLNQEYFPGVGNWMADEILWRAAIHPATLAGRLATAASAKKLRATIRRVARDALRVIAGANGKLPPDLNAHIPDSWLFNHRWEDGGLCPKTKQPLRREEIGGRTTCWSPAWQTNGHVHHARPGANCAGNDG